LFLEYMWNRYSVRRRSRRSRPEYRFERAITFDPTVGSPSNFYMSFRKLFFFFFFFDQMLEVYRSKNQTSQIKPANQKYNCTEQACGNRFPTSTRKKKTLPKETILRLKPKENRNYYKQKNTDHQHSEQPEERQTKANKRG